MAQNFRRFTSNAVGTSAATIFTANSYDTVVGISLANVNANAITVHQAMHLKLFQIQLVL
jgi:hypothetical protein